MNELRLPSDGPLSWAAELPFYQAGLAGYSDYAMRMVARKHGCPYCITEAMLDHFLINGGKGLEVAELREDDHPICGQLMGSHADEIAAGAKILDGLGYDVIDVNIACPQKKIKRKSRGGHLLSVPDEAIEILKAVADAVEGSRPLTVKMRRAFDDSNEALDGFHKIFQAAIELGYSGVTVHGRTVEQKYIGPSTWESLRKIVDEYGHEHVRHAATKHQKFMIGGSGDIWQTSDIFAMIEQTGVDVVSVARGCIGNPWIFEQARAMAQRKKGGGQGVGDKQGGDAPRIYEQRDVLLEHFELSMQLYGEQQAARMMRKFGIRFSRHHPEGEQIKAAFIKVKGLDAWQGVLDEFYAVDGVGVGVDAAVPDEARTQVSEESCGS
ncbi:putative tRNA-dihydrouridine synthase [Poriferisphaera corsica]|uniref:tRNA-dihydrouridine synthase n=1 Tax=Poriferisphaera corsica TaxID=2528020 RepID=A0A517YT93_9BACT|nr:tRNA-dihydrouridine synthase family protein [Poriferisphaera corsica]QDU33453.1 putative tRNA-dihydrouridine synthase [Poriferisphaera corsica]